MGDKKPFNSVPGGLRDILPAEVEERRTIEADLRTAFEGWGYREIITPTFEYFETLAIEAGNTIESEIFKFFDVDGSLLGLRPEMTTPIARVISKRSISLSPIDRLYYVANVFRQEPPKRGQRREFTQVGLELIGAKGEAADGEVISVLIEALLKSRLNQFKVAIGRVDFLPAVLEEFGAEPELTDRVQTLLAAKDIVEARASIEASLISEAAKEDVLAILSLKGDRSTLDLASGYAKGKKSKAILTELKSLAKLISLYGLNDFVTFDFGMVKDFGYYTGMVFEAYSPELGFPLGSGGRYDGLISEFKSARPACGFALGLERLHIALSEAKLIKRNGDKRVLVAPLGDTEAAFILSKESRGAGLKTEIAPLNLSLSECEEIAKASNFKFFIFMDGQTGQAKILKIKEGTVTSVAVSDIKGALT